MVNNNHEYRVEHPADAEAPSGVGANYSDAPSPRTRHEAQGLGLAARIVAMLLGTLVFGSGIIGLFFGEGVAFNTTNADLPLDIIRIVAGAVLLTTGFSPLPRHVIGRILLAVGILYVPMGFIALFQRTYWGLLPGGWTALDIALHIFGGVTALVIGLLASGASDSTLEHPPRIDDANHSGWTDPAESRQPH